MYAYYHTHIRYKPIRSLVYHPARYSAISGHTPWYHNGYHIMAPLSDNVMYRLYKINWKKKSFNNATSNSERNSSLSYPFGTYNEKNFPAKTKPGGRSSTALCLPTQLKHPDWNNGTRSDPNLSQDLYFERYWHTSDKNETRGTSWRYWRAEKYKYKSIQVWQTTAQSIMGYTLYIAFFKLSWPVSYYEFKVAIEI